MIAPNTTSCHINNIQSPFLRISTIPILRKSHMQYPNAAPRPEVDAFHDIGIHKHPRFRTGKLRRAQGLVLNLIHLPRRRRPHRRAVPRRDEGAPRYQLLTKTLRLQVRPPIQPHLVPHADLRVYVAGLDVQLHLHRLGEATRPIVMTLLQGEDDELPLPAGPERYGLERVPFRYGAGEAEEEASVEGHGICVDPVHVAHVTAYFAQGLEEVAVDRFFMVCFVLGKVLDLQELHPVQRGPLPGGLPLGGGDVRHPDALQRVHPRH
mmetsp:Transcript_34385/g.83169  ORF Transcript_34385/g.83169 Transcript_34385/m.83169 type:complete len:265 (-) Transcript_34385:638-1432(-)